MFLERCQRTFTPRLRGIRPTPRPSKLPSCTPATATYPPSSRILTRTPRTVPMQLTGQAPNPLTAPPPRSPTGRVLCPHTPPAPTPAHPTAACYPLQPLTPAAPTPPSPPSQFPAQSAASAPALCKPETVRGWVGVTATQ